MYPRDKSNGFDLDAVTQLLNNWVELLLMFDIVISYLDGFVKTILIWRWLSRNIFLLIMTLRSELIQKQLFQVKYVFGQNRETGQIFVKLLIACLQCIIHISLSFFVMLSYKKNNWLHKVCWVWWLNKSLHYYGLVYNAFIQHYTSISFW